MNDLICYKIFQCHYGNSDAKNIVGYADTLQNAKLLVDALMNLHLNRSITYYYELVDDRSVDFE